MSAVLAERRLTPTEQLEQARAAYFEMERALSTMQRLNGYARKTAGMKADYNAASQSYHQNKQIHDRIMRGLS